MTLVTNPYQYDSVHPELIPPALDGQAAIRGSVFADPAADWFDYSDTGNASADTVAEVVRGRAQAGKWSVVYSNQDGYPAMTAALARRGLGWSHAEAWPKPGVYLWLVDLESGPVWPSWFTVVRPVLIQFQWTGNFDLSIPAPNFPSRVAGYIDGPRSQWPASAWTRFEVITQNLPPDPPPAPPSQQPTIVPPEIEKELNDMQLINDAAGRLNVVGEAIDNHNLLVFTRNPSGQWSVIDVTDQLHGENAADKRNYQIQ